jgi:outer membrane protein insertion porin family
MRSVSSSGSALNSPRRSAACALALLLVVLLTTQASAYYDAFVMRDLRRTLAERYGPVLRSVRFVGNGTFDEDQLKPYMVSTESSTFRPARFNADVFERDLSNLKLYYTTQGFLEADLAVEDVAYGPDSTSVEIMVSVYEGERWRVTELTIDGNHDFPEEQLRGLLSIKEGDPFRTVRLAADRSELLGLYARNSYLDARVEQTIERDDIARTVSVRYDIVERKQARISEIRITGDEKTRGFVIARELTFAPGQLFDADRVGESQANLYKTGLFNAVWIEPARRDTGLVERRMDVRVSERQSVELSASVAYEVIDGPGASVEFTNRNVQGNATWMTLGGGVSYRTRDAGFTIGDNWLLGLPVTGEASLEYDHSNEDAYTSESERGVFSLKKELTKTLTVEGGYGFERNVVLTASADVDGVGTNYTTDVRVAATHDTRDDVLDATRGTLSRAEFRVASSFLGGTNDFTRTELAWRGFKEVREGRVLALSARAGWIHPQDDGSDVPVNERFFAGGEGSVRGFDWNSLGPVGEDGHAKGGRGLVELRTELRVPAPGPFRAVAILDAGQVFDDYTAIRLSTLSVGAGGGLRYYLGIWVFRLDIVAPVTENGRTRFYIGIGQAF